MAEKKRIAVERLVLSPRTQAREEMDPKVVAEYAERMAAGDKFPPISVMDVPDLGLLVWDGFQRVQAARAAKKKYIDASVQRGTLERAVLLAAGANATHGLPRNSADKRRAVMMVLELPESAELSDREIARIVGGVSHEFVRQRRAGIKALVNATTAPEPESEEETPDTSAAKKKSAKRAEKRAAAKTALEKEMQKAERAHDTLLAALSDCLASARDLAASAMGPHISIQAVTAAIKSAMSHIRDAKPGGPCPYCDGKGCATCRKSGWLHRAGISMAPKDLRPAQPPE